MMNSLGPEFDVRIAPNVLGHPDSHGWIVTHRRSGCWIYTGLAITLNEAAAELLEVANRVPAGIQ